MFLCEKLEAIFNQVFNIYFNGKDHRQHFYLLRSVCLWTYGYGTRLRSKLVHELRSILNLNPRFILIHDHRS